MCINDEGVPHRVPAIPVFHGGLIQAGTLIVGTADIEDAAITTAKINNLAVETLKIADNAVTVPENSSNAAAKTINGANVEVLSLAFTTTGLNPYIHFSGLIYGPWPTITTIKVYRDAEKIYEAAIYSQGRIGDDTINVPVSFAVIESTPPDADSYTYYVKASKGADDSYISNRNLYIQELKK